MTDWTEEDHSLRSGDHQGENDLRGAANDLESAMSGVAPSDPRVAEAVARLEQLSDLPPEEHVEVYEDVHRVLQDSLSAAHDPGEGQES